MSEEHSKKVDIYAIGTAAALEAADNLRKLGYDAVADGFDIIVRRKGTTIRLKNKITYEGRYDKVQEEIAKAIAFHLTS